MGNTTNDTIWILLSAGLVFLMQGGFLCLESGITRSKNAINVALKNVADFALAVVLFWMVGFGWMFGNSSHGLIGNSHFFVPVELNPSLATFFLFQAMFCATASTILSGAVAERMKFVGYVVATLLVSAIVYPIFGHWAWGGTYSGSPGWLKDLGFVDFAGSTVVHSIGGWAALAGVLVIGPRIGRFDDSSTAPVSGNIQGNNLPLAILGVVLLGLGWVGFNGGSTLAMTDQVPAIICNTFLAGTVGALVGLIIGYARYEHADVTLTLNGFLAGLVSITAGCHAVTSFNALLIGSGGCLVMYLATCMLERYKIDDVIAAVPVHGVAGVWGTLAVALFGDLNRLGTGLTRLEQLAVQGIGVFAAFAFAFSTTIITFFIVNRIMPLRVTAREEHLGLNIVEHGASTDVYDLLFDMEIQRQSGDFDRRVQVEPYTEVGAIAAQYNRVLDAVAIQAMETKRANIELSKAREDDNQSRKRLEESMAELEQFNELAVGRELRMIDLKAEVNELARQLDQPVPYDLELLEEKSSC